MSCFFGHKWTKWSAPILSGIWLKQHRNCQVCKYMKEHIVGILESKTK